MCQADTYIHNAEIDYHDGERYPVLERVDGTPDYLDDITKPRTTPALVGVYEPGVPGYTQIIQFTRATGVQPQVVLYYSGWGEPLPVRLATAARQHGAYTFVQLQPNGTTLAGWQQATRTPT